MDKLIIAAPLALLCGCASTQAVLQRDAEIIHSTKSVEAVTFCLQDKTGFPAMDREGAKVVLHKSAFGAVIATYSVKAEGTGSVIEIRQGSAPTHPRFSSCY